MTRRRSTAQHADLLANAITRFGFREPTATEPISRYIRDLIAHVEDRDFAAAHELKVGRPQADWTSEDVAAFQARMTRPRRDPHFDDPTVPFACVAIAHPEQWAVTDESLMTIVDKAFEFAIQFRTKDPTKDFSLLASVLLTTGQLLTATPSREDRFRVIRHWSRTQPVYGYVIAADAFIHAITHEPDKPRTATKQDAIMVHAGSRTMRRMSVQPYRISGGRAVFEERREVPPGSVTDDPYAGLLVSVPAPTGKPS